MASILGRLRGKRLLANEEPRNVVRSQTTTNGSVDGTYQQADESVDLGEGSSCAVTSRRHRLASSVDALLADSSALSFFIQFLESCDKLNLIKFWMHVEGFRASIGSEAVETSKEAAESIALIDATNIYEKYLEDEAVSSISLPRKLRDLVRENLSNPPISISCFDDAQFFVRRLFELRYFEEFRRSVYYKKHELEVLLGGCRLDDLLHIQSLLQSFMELMVEPEDMSRVQFLIASDSFESQYGSLNDEQALQDAMLLYDKYFSMQAPCRLHLGDSVRISIESAICSDDGRPARAAFAHAKRQITMIVEQKFLVDFIQSTAYSNYVTDISAQIDSMIELPRPSNGHCSARGSVASSSDSLSFVFKRHCENLERCQSFPEQSRRLLSPRNTGLAEVDNMGRYRPLYNDAIAQDAAKPFKLKTKLRRYLEKNQMRDEEIADEVAKSIIADVQSMVEAGRRG